MKTIFLALAIQCYISLTFSQAFEITRPGHGRDVFNIPASMCNRNAADSGRGCKTFYAVNGERNCSCLCPARNATFAFYNKGWSCVENRKLRRYLDRGKKGILFNSYNVVSLESLDVWTWGNKNSLKLWRMLSISGSVFRAHVFYDFIWRHLDRGQRGGYCLILITWFYYKVKMFDLEATRISCSSERSFRC